MTDRTTIARLGFLLAKHAEKSDACARHRKDSGAMGEELGRRASCPVIGVGASAGGLDAFTRLLRALPAHAGVALVLVQHLDPTQKSMLADILARETGLPVAEAANGMRIEPDHVYVMPPNAEMRLSHGVLTLVERAKPPAQALPIDTFLMSLADECAALSAGVVLSGTGHDGVVGLTAIRAAGGVTFAQDPVTAEYDGMPQAAIEADVVDMVFDPEGIAAQLVHIAEHPGTATHELVRLPQQPPASTALFVDEESFHEILSLVREATGLDLVHYRRSTLLRRINRRMQLESIDTMSEYLSRLREQPSETEALYRDVLVNVTEFFRDPDALHALCREVFPELAARKEVDAPIRIWVPGCSNGQEAYSIVISLVEFLDDTAAPPGIQMFASDVSQEDIEIARVGVYPEAIADEISSERLARFFTPLPGGYRVARAIRDMCVFAVHDVTKDPPFSRLDLVSFRNVLIYMESPLQERVLQILHYGLEPGGFLILGSAETIGSDSTLFTAVDTQHRIYKRQPGPARLLSALAPSGGAVGLAVRGHAGDASVAFDVLAEADKLVQGDYQPAGVVINTDLEVLQFRGDIAPFLDPAAGPPELKLPRLLSPTLSSTVEAGIREAAKTQVSAKRRSVSPQRDGVRREVDVEVVPISASDDDAYYLVLFTERPQRAARAAGRTSTAGASGEPAEQAAVASDAAVSAAEPDDAAILRRELDDTREQLEALVSEKDAANSDLRAASERLESSNEELRTLNEEYQTAQEELQSTNEELTTLNDELRNRNAELRRLNDDLSNVIEGVEIPILILDADLRIRRFTQGIEPIVAVAPTDIGRPLADLRFKIDLTDIEARIHKVLAQCTPSETETRDADGRWYSMRLRPYRASDGSFDGVVMAFIDIDELKASMNSAESARDHARAVVETVRDPLLTLGPDLRVREANGAFYRDFAVSAEETVGVPVYELGDGQWDFPELRSLLEGILPGDEHFAGLDVERDFPRVGCRVMELNARRVQEERGEPSILLTAHDITSIRRLEGLSTALNAISLVIGSTLEFDEVLEEVVKQSTVALGADSGAVLLRQDTTWVMKNVYGLPADLEGRVLDASQVPLARLSAEAGGPVVFDDVMRNEEYALSVGVELKLRSVVMIPLMLRSEVIGALSFHYGEPAGTFSDEDVDFARRVGTLLSLASENARLYSTQREIATTLQGALLTTPRKIAGVDFGYLYRSATVEARVGGDFYDIFDLNGQVGVLVGDVSGKGVQAATLTALVKNTVRALAYEGLSPAGVTSKTNAVIYKTTPSSSFVTLLFCILDTASGRLVYCSAGHPHGIIKRESGDIELLEVGSPLAGGFDAAEFNDGETTLDVGDVLVLYTDGVTEARQDGELYGEERLVDFVQHMPRTPSRHVTETIFGEILSYTAGKLSDDVAIVSVALHGKG